MTAPAPARARTPAAAPRWSLAVTCVTLALAYGVWYAYSVFLVALLREFGWSRSLLAGAFSLFALVQGATSPALGWLADRVGPRRVVTAGGLILCGGLLLDGAITRPWHLYAAFGLLTAAGVSAAGWVPAVVLVQRWYPERLGVMLGIAGAGIGAGIFVVVPLCQVLIDWLGWRWAFRAVGLLAALWILPMTLWLVRDPPRGPAPARPRAVPARPGEPSLGAAARTPPFWLLALTQGLGSFCAQTLLVHQAAYLVDHGIAALVAASVVSVVGGASILGKIGGGWLSDRLGREVVYTLGIGCVVASVGVLGLVALAPGPGLALAYGVLIGVGYSVTASLMPAVVGDRFRGRHFGAIFGMLQLFNALGGSAGPWVAGRIFDLTGSYRWAFLVSLAAAGVAVSALWAARRFPVAPGRRP